MSCRDTSGGSASLTLARARTRLSDPELRSLFHSLKREGMFLEPPTEREVNAWRARQEWLLKKVDIPDRQRESLEQRLFRSKGEPLPDGPTFYAWSRIEARAWQEVALRSAKAAVDLEPPGSQAEQYNLDENGRPRQVWYASYGSNLYRDRFLTYVQGGTIEGANRPYWGCRDTTPPEDDIPIRFDARPMFAMDSYTWGGGIAFMDAEGEGSGLGRAYLVTADQFDDIVSQENGMYPGEITTPLSDVITDGRGEIGDVLYGTLVHIGDHNGAPVVTFTGSFNTHDALAQSGIVKTRIRELTPKVNRPSPAYVRMIGAGLKETFNLSTVEQADYIRGCPGGDRWTRKELVTALRGVKLPEEIAAEKQARERADREARDRAARARQAENSSRNNQGFRFGSGNYIGPSGAFMTCSSCRRMEWCRDRLCETCRRQNSATPASLASVGATPKSKNTQPTTEPETRQPQPVLIRPIPDTHRKGWSLVRCGPDTAIRDPYGNIFNQTQLHDALARALDRQEAIRTELANGADGYREVLASNINACEDFDTALTTLATETENPTPPTNTPPAHTPTPTSARKQPPKTPTTRTLAYPASAPDRGLKVHITPDGTPRLRVAKTQLDLTQDEVLEWMNEQIDVYENATSRAQAVRASSIVDRLSRCWRNMEKANTPEGKKPRSLVHNLDTNTYGVRQPT